MDKKALLQAIDRACDWLVDIAQVKGDETPPCKRVARMVHKSYQGSFLGEYRNGKWDYFCPIWHCGQAVKALCMAYRATGNEKYLKSAELGGDFILRERFSDPAHPHYGLIFAVEDFGHCVNTSAILECLVGLDELYRVTGQEKYKEAFLAAAHWVASNAYAGGGHFEDTFDLDTFTFNDRYHAKFTPPDGFEAVKQRPLIDDAIFWRAYELSGDKRFSDIFFETADFLCENEYPAGTWGQYMPCDGRTGSIHPRQGFWWGLPMYDAYLATRDEKYLACLRRCGEFYLKAQRRDGGMFRNTYPDFNTDSFGHATSGTLCAAILWMKLNQIAPDPEWLAAAERSLAFGMSVQFIHVSDPNLKGAILEKISPPYNSDASPFQLRDLGTIFFVQAACMALELL